MKLKVSQISTDNNDYIKMFCDFVEEKGVKTQDSFEQRFDALATEFAMLHNGEYNPETKELIILNQPLSIFN